MEGHYANAVKHGDPTGGQFTDTSLGIIRDAARIVRGRTIMSSPEPVDLRSRRRAFTADEIERVAIEQFTARGFADVTVDEIAEAAGISPRTFFRYFPTKAHVVLAHQRRLGDRLLRALAARPADEGPVTALRAAFLATAQMRAEDRERMVLLGRVLSSARQAIVGDVGFEADQTERARRHRRRACRRSIRPSISGRPSSSRRWPAQRRRRSAPGSSREARTS